MQNGVSGGTLRWRLSSGQWQRLHFGVYAAFSGQPDRTARLWAAVLRAGTGAVLSHHTAAELFGLVSEPSSLIHVTIPAARRMGRVPDLVVHVSVRAEPARHPALAPPRTRIEETVLDLVDLAGAADQAVAWVTAALGRRLTTSPRLASALDRRPRIRWRAELVAGLAADMAGTHSVLEVRYLREVERPHGLPRGTRQAMAQRGARTVYRDVLYEEHGVAVELDGRLAHPGDARWLDIRRDNAAAAGGIVTLRYGWTDITQRPCLVAAEVAQALRRRGPVDARPCSPGCPGFPPTAS
jgi:hypothetical protein